MPSGGSFGGAPCSPEGFPGIRGPAFCCCGGPPVAAASREVSAAVGGDEPWGPLMGLPRGKGDPSVDQGVM